MPGDREAQAHHPVVPSGQGGGDAGRGDADRELRRDPPHRQRVQGDDGNLPVPDQPVQRVQREAQRSVGTAHRAV